MSPMYDPDNPEHVEALPYYCPRCGPSCCGMNVYTGHCNGAYEGECHLDNPDPTDSMTPGTSTYYGEYAPTLTEQLAARDAQVAELTAALAAFQYVNRPDGMMCWCTPPVVAAHYPAHGWTCNQARKVIAGHIG